VKLEDVVEQLSKKGWACSKTEPETILCFKNEKEVFIEPFYVLDREGRIVRAGWGIHVKKGNFHYDFKIPRRLEDAKKLAERIMENFDEAEKHLEKLISLDIKVE